MAITSMRAVHPGEVLREEFLGPLELTPNALAEDLRVPANRMYGIVKEERAITPDTALRLSRYFGTSPEFWMNLQMNYELRRELAEHGEDIARDVRPRAA